MNMVKRNHNSPPVCAEATSLTSTRGQLKRSVGMTRSRRHKVAPVNMSTRTVRYDSKSRRFLSSCDSRRSYPLESVAEQQGKAQSLICNRDGTRVAHMHWVAALRSPEAI